jgi:hypothetical protein
MTTQNEDTKPVKMARATKVLINALARFRDAQHSVMFQMTNPSLSFEYEFKKSGDAMELARIHLDEALRDADHLSWEIILEANDPHGLLKQKPQYSNL